MSGRLAGILPVYARLAWWGLVSPRARERVPSEMGILGAAYGGAAMRDFRFDTSHIQWVQCYSEIWFSKKSLGLSNSVWIMPFPLSKNSSEENIEYICMKS